jgi:membrane protease subunit HflK
MKWFLLTLVGLLLVLYTAATALTQVKSGELAVVRRFGRLLPNKPGPGLYVGLPWGMERVDRVAVGEARSIRVGFTSQTEEDSSVTPQGQLLTGDHNLVNVQAEVYYKVVESQVDKFALQADRVEPLLARLAEAALADWTAVGSVDDVLGKRGLAASVLENMRQRLDQHGYDLGIEIERVSIVRVFPPDEVKSAFEEVAKAQTRMETQQNAAERAQKIRISQATAEASQRVRLASVYAQEQRLQAKAEAAAFLKQQAQYEKLAATDPGYINTLWADEMTRIYARMKEAGRIDLLDHYLSKEGLTITEFPLLKKK